MPLKKFWAIAALFIVGVLTLSACSTPTTSTSLKMDMPDFVKKASASVREAYAFAIQNPHALETIPCFCGCGSMGHKSNLNCYIKSIDQNGQITFDNHAAGCGICVDITKDVMRLKQEGQSSLKIRQYIDAQYGSFGPSTNTPLPTE